MYQSRVKINDSPSELRNSIYSPGTDRIQNTTPVAVQLLLIDEIAYSIVSCKAIDTDCAEKTIPVAAA
jgi:hypothetical protein